MKRYYSYSKFILKIINFDLTFKTLHDDIKFLHLLTYFKKSDNIGKINSNFACVVLFYLI